LGDVRYCASAAHRASDFVDFGEDGVEESCFARPYPAHDAHELASVDVQLWDLEVLDDTA